MPKTKSHATRTHEGHEADKPERAKASEAREAPDPIRARAFWSGTLSFGLVSIPVDLHPATRTARASLRMLAPDGTPLSRRYFCPEHDAEVPSDELARGYEREPGEYVLVEDEELEALAPEKSRDIDLRSFVEAKAIDPMHFDRAYVLAPTGDSNKAYRLLADVMERRQMAGIATFVLRERQHVIAIFAERGLLRAQTLRLVDELRPQSEVGAPPLSAADKDVAHEYAKELHAAGAKKAASKELDPSLLADENEGALQKLAEAKRRRNKDVFVRDEPDEGQAAGAEVIDLLGILERSLGKDKRGVKHR